MSYLIDVVNFNSDASCLDSTRWFAAMDGGGLSEISRWLNMYVEMNKPICLGLTGGTIADLSSKNPEALQIIKSNPAIFQILARPFAHDLPFFRTDWGFLTNLSLGIKAAEKVFGQVSKYYLPPEFMMTNRQVNHLANMGMIATFIVRERFAQNGAAIPEDNFLLKGIPDGKMQCITCLKELTVNYLKTLQMLDESFWNDSITQYQEARLWRDGESFLLIPNGIEREKYWLENCDRKRKHLGDEELKIKVNSELRGYPVHPFSAWSNELSMLWFIDRIGDLEKNISGSHNAKNINSWLNCIGSDILAAVEKNAPVVQLKSFDSSSYYNYTILRSNRAFEGEAHLIGAETGCIIDGKEDWQLRTQIRENFILGCMNDIKLIRGNV